MGPTEPEGLTDGADQQACGGDDGDDGTRGGLTVLTSWSRGLMGLKGADGAAEPYAHWSDPSVSVPTLTGQTHQPPVRSDQPHQPPGPLGAPAPSEPYAPCVSGLHGGAA